MHQYCATKAGIAVTLLQMNHQIFSATQLRASLYIALSASGAAANRDAAANRGRTCNSLAGPRLHFGTALQFKIKQIFGALAAYLSDHSWDPSETLLRCSRRHRVYLCVCGGSKL
jgi:hypothetical protein